MKDLCPSSVETMKILKRLRQKDSEASTVDCKESLHLKEDGDCATFIRHISALANTGQKCCLLVGVEDITWIAKGIPPDSSLLLVDSTKQQMNQILHKKLDPPIQIDYRVYDIDGAKIGVVGLEGTKPPYIICIDQPRFGGNKTKGKESYIYQGVIYIRRGSDSVPLVHQSEILEILNGKTDYIGLVLALVVLSALVGVGVGIGSSQIQFSDRSVATLIGGMWGMLVGWILNGRLADALGKFSAGLFGRLIKNFGGLLWGGIMGAYLSYQIVDAYLDGRLEVQDPISMGFFIMPIVAVAFAITILLYAYLAGDVVNFIKKKIKWAA